MKISRRTVVGMISGLLVAPSGLLEAAIPKLDPSREIEINNISGPVVHFRSSDRYINLSGLYKDTWPKIEAQEFYRAVAARPHLPQAWEIVHSENYDGTETYGWMVNHIEPTKHAYSWPISTGNESVAEALLKATQVIKDSDTNNPNNSKGNWGRS